MKLIYVSLSSCLRVLVVTEHGLDTWPGRPDRELFCGASLDWVQEGQGPTT